MNNSLVEVIQSFAVAREAIFNAADYDTWNTRGTSATRDTVTTLAQLYQRQLQAAQIPRARLQDVVEYRCRYGGVCTRQVKDGKFHGTGTLKAQTEQHGRGKETYPDGSKYEGGFCCAGKRSGFGKYVWKDGMVYEGEWKDNEQHGQGKQIYADGSKYEGGYCAGKWHGFGKYVWKDGRVYEGEWKDNRRHGQGMRTAPDGRKYEGGFCAGKAHGFGSFVGEDGNVYEGEWKDSKPYGGGVWMFTDGTRYAGNWDHKSVDGVRIDPNGERTSGKFSPFLPRNVPPPS
jgi:hypothetical protein